MSLLQVTRLADWAAGNRSQASSRGANFSVLHQTVPPTGPGDPTVLAEMTRLCYHNTTATTDNR